MTDRLTELRDTIDRLDSEILDLIRQRMKLSASIIAAKNGSTPYRPGREAAVVQRLVDRAPDLAAPAVQNIWRQIMTASTSQQDSGLTIAVHRDAQAAASWHFGGLVQIVICDDLDAMRGALDGKATLAVVPETMSDGLATWMLEDTSAHIMSRTPLFGSEIPPAYIIGGVPADSAPHEMTVIARLQRQGAAKARLEIHPGRIENLADIDADTDANASRIAGIIATDGKTD